MLLTIQGAFCSADDAVLQSVTVICVTCSIFLKAGGQTGGGPGGYSL